MNEPHTERSGLLVALTALLFAEGALLACAVAWLVFELVTVTPASVATAVAFLVLTVVAAVWVLATAVFSLRARPWVRGSALTWQIIQAAIAVTALQGAGGTALAGILMLAASIAGVLLVLSRPVVSSMAHRPTGR